MYIASGEGSDLVFADSELSYLEELLSSIDLILSDVYLKIKNSSDPESDGLCDKGEYFLGVGFCAMQRYLVDVLQDTKINKGEALKLGPKNKEGVAISLVINAAGNYWKHSPEWSSWLEKLDDRSQRTVDLLIHHGGTAWYVLSDVLAELSDGEGLSLRSCIPYLKKWRQAVHLERKRNV